MSYASGETPMPGDHIRNKSGRRGTVTQVEHAHRNPSVLQQITIKWDEGVVGIDYTLAGDFILISRKPKA